MITTIQKKCLEGLVFPEGASIVVSWVFLRLVYHLISVTIAILFHTMSPWGEEAA